jgi:hypothetical protein
MFPEKSSTFLTLYFTQVAEIRATEFLTFTHWNDKTGYINLTSNGLLDHDC